MTLLFGCGGGSGSSSDPVPIPEPVTTTTDPTLPEPTPIDLLDALPSEGSVNVDPQHTEISFASLGYADLAIAYSGSCADLNASTIRRSLLDMGNTEFDEVIEHRLRCSDLAPMTSYTFTADGQRATDDQFRTSTTFSTGTAPDQSINVLTELIIPQSQIDDLFKGYVEGALLSELNLPSLIETLVIDGLVDLAEANWSNLVDPDALYDVVTQQVSYSSRTPSGDAAATLTGLIAMPSLSTADNFTQRNRVIVLSHATGSTPGELSPGDAWYILASQFASRGYLVVAADNWGRGGTDVDAETYLMANRTAVNSLDLLKLTLADSRYADVYNAREVTIIGYSQGGYSALALWQLIQLTRPGELTVSEVYAGGAPYNLYETFKGVVQHLAGTCNGGAYCQFVDRETTVPFATDRILPGFLSYSNTGEVALGDVVNGNTFSTEFIEGFLADDPSFDALKVQLQLNSFTNIQSPETSFGNSNSLLHLYHSGFDRLVPIANTDELAALLSPHISVNYHQNQCNSSGYQLVSSLTDIVGVMHTLCGLAVLDDAMDDLK